MIESMTMELLPVQRKTNTVTTRSIVSITVLATTIIPTIKLFADTPQIDMITGGAGWVGAGLLGLVLSWLLLVRLPSDDKTKKDMMDVHTKQINEMIVSRDALFQLVSKQHDEAFAVAEKERRADYQTALQVIVNNHQRESDVLRGLIDKNATEVSSVVIDLRRAIEELREAIYGELKKLPRRPE